MPYYPQTPGIYPYTTATAVGVTVAYVATTNTTILAANANRRGGMIYNSTGVSVQISLGNSALSNPTVVLVAGAYYEIPFGWTGRIDAYMQAGGGGGLWLTELTA